MKKNIKVLLIQFIFLAMQLPFFADSYANIYFYATKLYENEAYEEAEVEYKRYLFMQNYEKGKYEAGALCALGGLYELKGNYSLAAECLQKAIVCLEQQGESESYIDSIRCSHISYLQKAAANTNTYLNDNLFIFSYMNLPEFSDKVRIKAYSASILDAVQNGRIEYAQKAYNSSLELFPEAWNQQQQETLNLSFERLGNFKPKNQKLAGYLSLMPGLGQFYAENYKDSLNAFLLNGSLLAVSAWSICTLDFWTFSLLEFNPLIRFWRGNIYNAQKDAYQYNVKKQQELSQPICEILENAL